MSDLFDQIKVKAAELLGEAGGAAETAHDKAGDAADQAKEVLAAAASEHGTKVAQAVHSAGELVDDKTGGRTAPVTGAVAQAADKAVEALGGEAEPPPI